MPERPLSRQRPYLLRAMHEWMTDNALTPHIVVDASCDGLDLRSEHVKENKIVLNVSYAATRGLVVGNEAVTFEARFNGVPKSMRIPIDAVLGIYARENGQGMVFTDDPTPVPPPDDSGGGRGKKPALKVVK
jgi:stringent starvation protein B